MYFRAFYDPGDSGIKFADFTRLVELVYRQYRLSPHPLSFRENSELSLDQVPQRISGTLLGRDPRPVVSDSQSPEIHSLGHACTANHFGSGVSATDQPAEFGELKQLTMSVSVSS